VSLSPEDPLVATLEHLFEGQEGNTKLLAEISRDIQELSHELTGAIRAFGKSHGELQAMEKDEAEERKRIHADIRKASANIDVVRKLVEGIALRQTNQEGRIAGLELAMGEKANGANGTDHG